MQLSANKSQWVFAILGSPPPLDFSSGTLSCQLVTTLLGLPFDHLQTTDLSPREKNQLALDTLLSNHWITTVSAEDLTENSFDLFLNDLFHKYHSNLMLSIRSTCQTFIANNYTISADEISRLDSDIRTISKYRDEIPFDDEITLGLSHIAFWYYFLGIHTSISSFIFDLFKLTCDGDVFWAWFSDLYTKNCVDDSNLQSLIHTFINTDSSEELSKIRFSMANSIQPQTVLAILRTILQLQDQSHPILLNILQTMHPDNIIAFLCVPKSSRQQKRSASHVESKFPLSIPSFPPISHINDIAFDADIYIASHIYHTCASILALPEFKSKRIFCDILWSFMYNALIIYGNEDNTCVSFSTSNLPKFALQTVDKLLDKTKKTTLDHLNELHCTTNSSLNLVSTFATHYSTLNILTFEAIFPVFQNIQNMTSIDQKLSSNPYPAVHQHDDHIHSLLYSLSTSTDIDQIKTKLTSLDHLLQQWQISPQTLMYLSLYRSIVNYTENSDDSLVTSFFRFPFYLISESQPFLLSHLIDSLLSSSSLTVPQRLSFILSLIFHFQFFSLSLTQLDTIIDLIEESLQASQHLTRLFSPSKSSSLKTSTSPASPISSNLKLNGLCVDLSTRNNSYSFYQLQNSTTIILLLLSSFQSIPLAKQLRSDRFLWFWQHQYKRFQSILSAQSSVELLSFVFLCFLIQPDCLPVFDQDNSVSDAIDKILPIVGNVEIPMCEMSTANVSSYELFELSPSSISAAIYPIISTLLHMADHNPYMNSIISTLPLRISNDIMDTFFAFIIGHQSLIFYPQHASVKKFIKYYMYDIQYRSYIIPFATFERLFLSAFPHQKCHYFDIYDKYPKTYQLLSQLLFHHAELSSLSDESFLSNSAIIQHFSFNSDYSAPNVQPVTTLQRFLQESMGLPPDIQNYWELWLSEFETPIHIDYTRFIGDKIISMLDSTLQSANCTSSHCYSFSQITFQHGIVPTQFVKLLNRFLLYLQTQSNSILSWCSSKLIQSLCLLYGFMTDISDISSTSSIFEYHGPNELILVIESLHTILKQIGTENFSTSMRFTWAILHETEKMISSSKIKRLNPSSQSNNNQILPRLLYLHTKTGLNIASCQLLLTTNYPPLSFLDFMFFGNENASNINNTTHIVHPHHISLVDICTFLHLFHINISKKYPQLKCFFTAQCTLEFQHNIDEFQQQHNLAPFVLTPRAVLEIVSIIAQFDLLVPISAFHIISRLLCRGWPYIILYQFAYQLHNIYPSWISSKPFFSRYIVPLLDFTGSNYADVLQQSNPATCQNYTSPLFIDSFTTQHTSHSEISRVIAEIDAAGLTFGRQLPNSVVIETPPASPKNNTVTNVVHIYPNFIDDLLELTPEQNQLPLPEVSNTAHPEPELCSISSQPEPNNSSIHPDAPIVTNVPEEPTQHCPANSSSSISPKLTHPTLHEPSPISTIHNPQQHPPQPILNCHPSQIAIPPFISSVLEAAVSAASSASAAASVAANAAAAASIAATAAAQAASSAASAAQAAASAAEAASAAARACIESISTMKTSQWWNNPSMQTFQLSHVDSCSGAKPPIEVPLPSPSMATGPTVLASVLSVADNVVPAPTCVAEVPTPAIVVASASTASTASTSRTNDKPFDNSHVVQPPPQKVAEFETFQDCPEQIANCTFPEASDRRSQINSSRDSLEMPQNHPSSKTSRGSGSGRPSLLSNVPPKPSVQSSGPNTVPSGHNRDTLKKPQPQRDQNLPKTHIQPPELQRLAKAYNFGYRLVPSADATTALLPIAPSISLDSFIQSISLTLDTSQQQTEAIQAKESTKESIKATRVQLPGTANDRSVSDHFRLRLNNFARTSMPLFKQLQLAAVGAKVDIQPSSASHQRGRGSTKTCHAAAHTNAVGIADHHLLPESVLTMNEYVQYIENHADTTKIDGSVNSHGVERTVDNAQVYAMKLVCDGSSYLEAYRMLLLKLETDLIFNELSPNLQYLVRYEPSHKAAYDILVEIVQEELNNVNNSFSYADNPSNINWK